MASTALYSNVVPLNRDRHRNLRLRADGPLRFAANAHFMPLAAIELFDAARDYPIVFAGGEDATPVAVLGLRSGENLFVDANGRWADTAYVPAFVRRYPFVLSGVDQTTQFTVCLDESYEGLSESEGTRLFDDDGKESELVTRIVEVLKNHLTEFERTRRFVERLRELDVFSAQDMQVKDSRGRTFALREFRTVDEKKLKALGDDVIGELNRSGYLGCIYAHLVSLGNVLQLAARVPLEAAGEPAE